MAKTNRNVMVDCVKAIAIIAVFFYHLQGIFPNGYLGVDVFFVISGYYLIKNLHDLHRNDSFSFFEFYYKKLIRLVPLLLFTVIIALFLGFWLMLPDDLENLGESSVASVIYSNNVLACITTKNYWNPVNLYKPLMHTWYLGVLIQAIVIIPIFYHLFFLKIHGNKVKTIIYSMFFFFSMAAFICPFFGDSEKFYYLPFRLFEILAGGFVVFFDKKNTKNTKNTKILFIGLLVLLSLLLWLPYKLSCRNIWVLVAVVLTTLILKILKESKFDSDKKAIIVFSKIGASSYSIYLIHQAVIAFAFYAFFERCTLFSTIIIVFITAATALISYNFVEIRLTKLLQKFKKITCIAFLVAFSVIICGFGLGLYFSGGVVRDVPELDIYIGNAHKGMHSEYCDIPYNWINEYEIDKIKVAVIGNSFGRDWCNILNESAVSDQISIRYISINTKIDQRKIQLIDNADVVFITLGPGLEDISDEIKYLTDGKNYYIVGNKKFGESNGIIYNKRYSDNYFQSRVKIDEKMLVSNKDFSDIYGNRYIDIIDLLVDEEGRVPVFTPNHKFISQDCDHLTRNGAVYLSNLITFDEYFFESKE